MKNNKSAFTLVELMVVLAIVALLSALIFGAISSIREGNKRGGCQSNLNQIYAAMRLYGQDNDGQLPYLNPSVAIDANKTPSGISGVISYSGPGLWALYVYAPRASQDPLYSLPLSNNDSQQTDPRVAGTLASYLKTPRAFHCPSDDFNKSVDYLDATGAKKTQIVPSGEIEFKGDVDGRQHLNPYYVSYQGNDDVLGNPAFYSSFRANGAKRQLRYFNQDTATTVSLPDRRSPDQTVVTWCRFHRALNADGTTRTSLSDYYKTNDNVLFLDGSVQSIPMSQSVTTLNGNVVVCQGWHRVPLAIENSAPNYLSDSTSPDYCG